MTARHFTLCVILSGQTLLSLSNAILCLHLISRSANQMPAFTQTGRHSDLPQFILAAMCFKKQSYSLSLLQVKMSLHHATHTDW